MCPMPPIYTPLGRGGNHFQKKLLKIITRYRREDLNQNQIAFLKKEYREIDEMIAVLAAFGTEIHLKSLPFSVAFIDVYPAADYPMRRRKSPVWQRVKDFEKTRFIFF